MTGSNGFIPYCGTPPVPGAMAWNLDPVLLTVLVTGAVLYAWKAVGIGASRGGCLAFYSGWAVLTLAMVSPLCNLGVALFSARVVQHMAVALISAPLLIIGRLDEILLRDLSRKPIATGAVPGRWEITGAAPLFALVLWLWHLGGPYDAALRNNVIYWTMDLSLFAVSLILWRTLLRTADGQPIHSLVVSVFTGMQMSVLGALLTFSAQPWFAAHAFTSWAWGLSPLDDQRLGGLIMWVPGGLLLTGYTVFLLGRHLVANSKGRATADFGS